MEGDLLVPGLGVGADHDFPVGDLGQDAEAKRQGLLQQSPRALAAERLTAEQGRNGPQPEDALDDRRGLQVHTLGDRQGDGRGRADLELVVLVNLGIRDEPVQELIVRVAFRAGVAVAGPGDGRPGAVGQDPAPATAAPAPSSRIAFMRAP